MFGFRKLISLNNVFFKMSTLATNSTITRNASNASNKSNGSKFNYEDFFTRKVEYWKREKRYRVFMKVNRDAAAFPEADEYTNRRKRIIVWCSNDVLGLSSHPSVKTAVKEAVDKYGTGSGGARGISGNSLLHEAFEKELAHFHGKESAFLSTSGFLSNASSISILGKMLPDCEIFSAGDNHASLIEGIARSNVPKHIFRNDDPPHLEELISKSKLQSPKLVILESVTSMTGLRCPVKEICTIAKKYGALTFVDEVHAVGLYGRTGAGIGEMQGAIKEMDVIVGSLGKSIGNIGAYLAGNASLIDTVRSYAPGFVFTTALPPMSLAGSLAALQIIKSEEGQQLREKHQTNVKYLKGLLASAGLPVEINESHIIPVHMGNPELCTKLANELMHYKGHYVPGVNYPTVPLGQERLRITPTPAHTKKMMGSLVNDLAELWEKREIKTN